MLLFLLAACAHCPSGYELDDSGTCVSSDGSGAVGSDGDGQLTWAEIEASFPACVAEEAGSELDFTGGCVDGACIGMSTDDVEAALGTPEVCDSSMSACEYPGGISVDFGSGAAVQFVIEAPYGGRDAHGLGIGVSFSCFADQFGSPDAMSTYLENGVASVYNLDWYDAGVDAFDHDAFGSDQGDWLVDTVYIEGAAN